MNKSPEQYRSTSPAVRVKGTLVAMVVLLFPLQAMSRSACEKLASLSLPDTAVIVARQVPAGWPRNIGDIKTYLDDSKGLLPAFCRVSLIVKPQINIEVWLPERTWNKRFRAEGIGGYGGRVSFEPMAEALRAGYATASTDTGHPFNVGGAFALKADGSLNRELIEDFAYRSLHQLVVQAKRVIQAYYGISPEYSYWKGCSGGGRQGLVAVQRFPEEYDGVLVECPAINWDRLVAAMLWPQIVIRETVGRAISAEKLDTATKAAIAACDHIDGVVDGLISEPRQCNYDPTMLVCGEKSDVRNCLSAQEATAIRRIWEGPKSAKTGAQLWFGIERGAALSSLAGPQPVSIPAEHLRYWIRQDPTVDWRTVTAEQFEQDFEVSQAKFRKELGTDNPDLRRFRQHGGKLIMLHGEGDEVVPPRGTLDYFNRVVAANGRHEVNEFIRLYMLPGIGHACSLASGSSLHSAAPFPSKIFDALVDWVEKGIAPDSLEAFQLLPGGAIRSRPVCPYPKKAKWIGDGSSDDASNYVCTEDADTQHNLSSTLIAN